MDCETSYDISQQCAFRWDVVSFSSDLFPLLQPLRREGRKEGRINLINIV
jgi:hypothetical protein